MSKKAESPHNAEIRERLYAWLKAHYPFESTDNPNITEAAKQLGVGRAHLFAIVQGHQRMTSDILYLLATKFEIDIHWLITGQSYQS